MIPDIPIIVVGYNRPGALQRLLESLKVAVYPSKVKLYISIDGEGDAAVKDLAQNFHWPHGEKEYLFHEVNLGLRNHVLSCGDLSQKHDAVIVLEDDLVVSPHFYRFATEAYTFYKDHPKIAGVSLYHHAYNETAQFPFLPIADGSDVYFFQYASSWGQLWTRESWAAFRGWYDHSSADKLSDGISIPPNIKLWPDNSWKKYFIRYIILHDLYFVYPRISMTTIFGDEGTNIRIRETFLQVPLWNGDRTFHFIDFEDSFAVYDTYCEILPEKLKQLGPSLPSDDFAVDLYGTKPLSEIKTEYVLSGKKCKKPDITFGREMKPHEANIIYKVPGSYFSFSRAEDFEDPPYLVQLLRCHQKHELSYWYPIRDYHFHGDNLLATNRKFSVSFLAKKSATMMRFAARYFFGKR